ncbi:unnamed protein product [Medioppia subpectinata]|uniref:Uncharacterized protein n=1 Tax=Medioppia subpectinata TaxID=1979941 RepID=A0A7R9KM67_9ACAR|nr:unnamed protein product [Medioppia subpectinata]CAG2105818.1 unnamed protein product [Medioppia subpectinata]
MANNIGFSSALKITDLNDFITPSQTKNMSETNDKSDKQKIRESAEESLKQLTEELERLSSGDAMPGPDGQPLRDRWTEDNWEQEMAKHPFFNTNPNVGYESSPLVDALRDLKYDKEFNSKEELVNSYREDGNENFRRKKYLWAVESYSEAIKVDSEDNALMSIVYNNRSSAHYYLQNYRSSANDAIKAYELDSNNQKALIRIVLCYFELKEYSKCLEICRNNSHLKLDLLSDYEKKASIEVKIKERNERKDKTETLKRKQIEDKIQSVVNERGVKFMGSLFDSIHPAADGKHVTLDESGGLVWPVLLLYPEYGESDFIEMFAENHTFIQHLNVMFAEFADWDTKRKYKPNDIIACIKPIEKSKEKKNVKTTVEISLGDCLACSGCITSAETVLIEQQSHEELYRIIDFNKKNPNKKRTIVVSMSLQSMASIAAKYRLSVESAAQKMSSFFHSLGVDYIFDTSLAQHFSLIESQKEFMDRFEKKQFPVLSSVCPGFVCYAEKTHGELVVPLLSRVKSGQQIMGLLVQQFLKDKKLTTSDVFHITLMPCYDKKLEATRSGSEFCDLSDDHKKEVDIVLTPIELEVMLNKESVVLSELSDRPLDSITEDSNDPHITSHLGSGSGGYVENVFRFMAAKYFDSYYKAGQQLEYKVLRNKDFIDLTLEDESGNKLLSFAIINGFRNIQTLVQRIKRKTCHYQYVEVMACPSGCLNGGAQVRPESVDEPLLERVEELYKSIPITSLPVDSQHKLVIDLYDKHFPNEDNAKLYAVFKAVPKTKNLINVNW